MRFAMIDTSSPATPTFMPHPRKPALKLPRGACDAHVHVFGPGKRFPYASTGGATPADAPKEMLFALHDFLSLTRCVIVHTAAHGIDNSATADALAARAGRYRGPIPDDGELVDLIAEIAPSEAQRQALLVDNPQRLYRFDTENAP